jgi:beta-lactam-binding protein with PASTA domain
VWCEQGGWGEAAIRTLGADRVRANAMAAISDQFGRVLRGRYRLDSALGLGGSGRVYRARDLDLDRDVAIKVLHPGLADDEFFFRRFQAEARTAAGLNHPNVVHVYDWGIDDGEPFLVLEHLAGGSLRRLLDRRRVEVAQVAQIGAGAARGLEYAHLRGLVHRDIKPANLLFDEAGTVHVADFGIARVMAEAPWSEPAGIVLGTARYVSPEQAVGAALSDRSDVYSLAVVCWEAAVGRPPFDGETAQAILLSRVSVSSLPAAPELGPLEPILIRSSAGDPADRPSAGEFADALEQIADGRVDRGRIVGGAVSDVTTVAPAGSMTSPLDGTTAATLEGAGAVDVTAAIGAPAGRRATTRRHRSRRRWARWLAAAIVVAVLAVGGGAAWVHFGVYGRVVPDLKGMPVAAATRLAAKDGVAVGRRTSRFSTTAPAGAVVTQSVTPGARVKSGTVIDLVVSRGHAPVLVPRLVGMTGTAATAALRAAHFAVRSHVAYNESVPAGVVVAASPASGTAAYGSPVTIDLSQGPAPRTIPDLSGLTTAAARQALTALRLGAKVTRAYSDTVAAGTVIATAPPAHTTGVAVGTTVAITVSRGPRLVTIPSVSGATIAAAVAALSAAGLTVNEQIGPPFATKATTTQPAPGSQVLPGSNVTLYVA